MHVFTMKFEKYFFYETFVFHSAFFIFIFFKYYHLVTYCTWERKKLRALLFLLWAEKYSQEKAKHRNNQARPWAMYITAWTWFMPQFQGKQNLVYKQHIHNQAQKKEKIKGWSLTLAQEYCLLLFVCLLENEILC